LTDISISLIVFACVFGGAILGMFLNATLPEHHLSDRSKDVVKLGMGLVGTMAAMVLGLQLSSAKSAYDTQSTELTQVATKAILLDRALAHYGPGSDDLRGRLRSALTDALQRLWPEEGTKAGTISAEPILAESLYDKIQALRPEDELQRSTKATALSIAYELGQTRWLMIEQQANSVNGPLIAIVVLWLTIIFVSFGMFSPRNATVFFSLMICASAVSAAIFLILEMYSPYSGVIRLSSAPLRNALEHLGR